MAGSSTVSASPDPTPTPAPASEQRAVQSVDHIAWECRVPLTLEDVPVELRDNPIIRTFALLPPEEQAKRDSAAAAWIEAARLYGDDAELERQALADGTHPLHRLDRNDAEALAR